MSFEAPIRGSYRVMDGLLAGAYLGSEDELRALLRHGITLFLDLTHPADPLDRYERCLEGATARGAHPIVDLGTPTIPRMSRILDDVDATIARRGSVYVHCWGGIGC